MQGRINMCALHANHAFAAITCLNIAFEQTVRPSVWRSWQLTTIKQLQRAVEARQCVFVTILPAAHRAGGGMAEPLLHVLFVAIRHVDRLIL